MPTSLGVKAATRFAGPAPYTRNFKRSNTVRLRRMLLDVRSGVAGGVLACHGNSTTAGYQGSAVLNQFKVGPPAQLAVALRAAGIDAMCQNRFATGGTTEAIGASDNRLATTGGWATGSGFTLGGGLVQGTAAGNFTFTPDEPVDSIDIYYARLSSGGVFTYALDGGAATQVNTSGTSGYAKIPLTMPVGVHTVTLAWVSGTANAIGFAAWDSTRRCVNVMNWGHRGTTTTRETATDQGYRALRVAQGIAPDAILLRLGINDAGQTAITVATFRANLIAYLNAMLPVSDVILETPHHPQAGFYTGTFEGSYTYLQQMQRMMDVLYELSSLYDLPLIDLWSRFDDYVTFNARGLFADAAHMRPIGYGDIAQVETRAVMSVL